MKLLAHTGRLKNYLSIYSFLPLFKKKGFLHAITEIRDPYHSHCVLNRIVGPATLTSALHAHVPLKAQKGMHNRTFRSTTQSPTIIMILM